MLNSKTQLPSDTEFGTAKEMLAQYCIQALSFNELRPIWNLCVKEKLLSPYLVDDDTEAKAAFDSYLNVAFEKRAKEDLDKDRRLNESNRICALRDFYRRNAVIYMTRGLQANSQRNLSRQVKVELNAKRIDDEHKAQEAATKKKEAEEQRKLEPAKTNGMNLGPKNAEPTNTGGAKPSTIPQPNKDLKGAPFDHQNNKKVTPAR
jgi:hypothetical protein